MPEARRSVQESAVGFSRNVVLFVEGTEDSLDVDALRTLLGPLDMRVEPLGPAFSLISAAQAMKRFHAHYYFVIDRDSRSDDVVEQSWADFVDAGKTNLAIWSKRHLESYFLDPDYLSRCPWLTVGTEQVKTRIIECAWRRVFLDLANAVLEALREDLRRPWIKLLRNCDQVSGIDDAWRAVDEHEQLRQRPQDVAEALAPSRLREVFDEKTAQFFGSEGPTELHWDQGRWLDFVDAKKILPEVVPPCFRVEDTAGNILQGPEKIRYLARSLLRLPPAEQPEDLQKLYRAMEQAKASYQP